MESIRIMAPRTVRTVAALRHKRDEIAKAVAEYEGRLAEGRADLAHITGAIALFESTCDINR